MSRVGLWLTVATGPAPAVALSGGVDSSVVAAVAVRAHGERALLLTARSPSLSRVAEARVRAVVAALGARHRFVETGEVGLPAYRRNGPDRCFVCKMAVYRALLAVARADGRPVLFDGANADDDAGDRPGMAAARRLGVVSPLRDAGLGKAEVRALARALGLPTATAPPDACLSSRIPTGVAVDERRLAMVAEAEERLLALGLSLVRVRWHGEMAVIEVPGPEVAAAARRADEILAAVRAAGFRRAALDLTGYGQGAHGPLAIR